jgi:hypothetical protein
MPFTGTLLSEFEPERECWHESGHAVVAQHLGMRVVAIGYAWVRGQDSEPNPCNWIATDGFDKDIVAIELFAGMAAEVVKLGDYDIGAYRLDVQAWQALGCGSSTERYINQTIEILRKRDDRLVRVYDRLMEERTNPSHNPFVDTDNVKRQVHLTQEEFESLL